MKLGTGTKILMALALAGAAVYAGAVLISPSPSTDPHAGKPTRKPDPRRPAGHRPGMFDAGSDSADPAASPGVRKPSRTWPVAEGAGRLVDALKQAASKPADEPQPEPAIPEPVARQALALVGADPLAETVWAQAINDPALSAEHRKDLIEDLNEEGFADPHNPTLEELPLVERRMELIEQMAPDALDDVNADAFAEAYKDLVAIYERLTRP